jgi:hypothetical protein
MVQAPTKWFRETEIVLGSFSIIVALVVFLNPPGFDPLTLIFLLSFGLLFNAIRLVATGGVKIHSWRFRGIVLAGGALIVVIFGL